MKKCKGMAVAALAAAMMLSLAACGKSDKTGDETASRTDATASDAVVGGNSSEEFVDDGDWTTTEAVVIEDDSFSVVEGTDVMGLTFDKDMMGFVSYKNDGSYTLSAENGELVADITSQGRVEHGCQAYYDGFTMAKGCVYTLSFDVRCDVERVIQWRIQINGGDFHAYAMDHVQVGPDTQKVTCTFTMEDESDPAPRFVFNLGSNDQMPDIGTPHKIYFDNISLVVTDSSKAEIIEGVPEPIKVTVNQIGYAPEDEKFVYVVAPDDYKFKVVNVDTDETVYVGPISKPRYDTGLNEKAGKGEFTAVKTPGRYKIISCPSGASYEFEIGEGLYADVYKDLVKMLYNQRCGTKLDASVSGDFAHDACHTGDAIIYGDNSGKTVDVSGGWHDAGDYGRYVVPGAKTVQDLLLAYEDYKYTADDIGIPESGNGVPDLLDEARYELEWMLKMQDEATGGVYHKVTGLVFPETVVAVDETAQMVLAPISYAATGDFAAVMAKASVLYREYDSAFADICLEAAKKAYEYNESADMSGFKNPEDIVTGEYPDTRVDDERLWAAAELYIATKDARYEAVVNEVLESMYQTGLGWDSIGTYAEYDLYKAEGVSESIKSATGTSILAQADRIIDSAGANIYGVAYSSKFSWGSNMNIANDGNILLFAYAVSGDENYLNHARLQRNYIFGTNGVGYCFVTGYGTLSPQATHHRPSQVLGKTMPGMLVGGANSNFEDPYSNAVLHGLGAGRCYVDNEQSYSCNEITIYWNSPLIYLLSGTCK